MKQARYVGARCRTKCAWSVACCLTLAALAAPAWGLETDQFTVPPQPLVDLAPQFRQHVIATLQEIVAEANARHLDLSRRARRAPAGPWRNEYQRAADECLTDDYVAHALYRKAGHGLPEAVLEHWVRTAEFPDGPFRYDIDAGESVYGNILQRPVTLQELSPTINIYGVYLGTDKVGHFIQQGCEYYELFRREETSGGGERAGYRRAVELGKFQEKTFFGEMMVGVYSNGDLAANYAGFKFYLNLTRPITAGREYRPPILVRRDGRWEVNPAAGQNFLRPFFTQHLNESFNPCRYAWFMRDTVRENMRVRAGSWASFYRTDRDAEARRVVQLSTWYGEDYGHSGFEHVITPADTCFDTDRALLARDRLLARRAGQRQVASRGL